MLQIRPNSVRYSTLCIFAKLKQSGEQEEPLFMALIVKENLPLSTHRRPYLRFSEEARGPSGQSQLQPAQMRIDCTGIRLFFRPRNKRIGAEPREEVAPQTSTLSSIRRLNPVQRQEFTIHSSPIDKCQYVQAVTIRVADGSPAVLHQNLLAPLYAWP